MTLKYATIIPENLILRHHNTEVRSQSDPLSQFSTQLHEY